MTGSYEALVNEGDLRLIDSDTLRDSLAALFGKMGDGNEQIWASRSLPGTALLLTAALVACDTGPPSGPNPTFDDLFPEVDRITLEEAANDPLTEITSLTPLADGRLLVVDGPSGRVLEYGPSGDLRRSLGRPGEGPGELREPAAAAEGTQGGLHVVERGSARRTVFWPADSVTISRLPGSYGFWLRPVDSGFIVGVGTSEARFAALTPAGELRARFGQREPRIQETPFWVFFVQDRAALLGDRVFINASFSPTVRVFSISGDSLGSFGTPPPGWIEPTHPGIATLADPGSRERLEEWARSFTVVTGLAATEGAVLVQYGRHDPAPSEPYRLVRSSADVYGVDGDKLAEGLELSARVLAGGPRLYLLAAEPPEPWTLSAREWAGDARGPRP